MPESLRPVSSGCANVTAGREWRGGSGRWTMWVILAAALAVCVAGFLGVDRWFYSNVSCVLNTEDRPLDRDFYSVTKPLWLALRATFGYALVGAVAAIAVLVARPRQWRRVAVAAAAVAAAGLTVNVMQGLVGRVRPNQATTHLQFRPRVAVFTKHGGCFPSGEAATALALASVLSHAWPRGRIAYFALAALAAGARLVNGAHYVSDVVAGGAYGAVVAALVLVLLEKWAGAVPRSLRAGRVE